MQVFASRTEDSPFRQQLSPTGSPGQCDGLSSAHNAKAGTRLHHLEVFQVPGHGQMPLRDCTGKTGPKSSTPLPTIRTGKWIQRHRKNRSAHNDKMIPRAAKSLSDRTRSAPVRNISAIFGGKKCQLCSLLAGPKTRSILSVSENHGILQFNWFNKWFHTNKTCSGSYDTSPA